MPSNLILCNGTNYTKCSAGTDFVCPSNGGSAYCQLQQLIQPQTAIIQNQSANNTQQIVQNTTPLPVVCNPNWNCSNWSACSGSQQVRTCNDTNSCGNLNNKPSEYQSCVETPVIPVAPVIDCSAYQTGLTSINGNSWLTEASRLSQIYKLQGKYPGCFTQPISAPTTCHYINAGNGNGYMTCY